MLIIIVLVVLVILGIWLEKSIHSEFVGGMMAITAVVCLFVCVIGLPLNRMNVHSRIKEFQAVERIVANKGNLTEIERAALVQEVAKVNKWLVSKQYFNATVFDIWIPDEVENMKEIKS